MTENENDEHPKRVWPWILLAGVILWIAISVFWVWREVQRVKRQKITRIELQDHFVAVGVTPGLNPAPITSFPAHFAKTFPGTAPASLEINGPAGILPDAEPL